MQRETRWREPPSCPHHVSWLKGHSHTSHGRYPLLPRTLLREQTSLGTSPWHGPSFRWGGCMVLKKRFQHPWLSWGAGTRGAAACCFPAAPRQPRWLGCTARCWSSSKSITAGQGIGFLEVAELDQPLKHRSWDGRHFLIISTAVLFPGEQTLQASTELK